MARLQILELPEGSGDDRAPFVVVLDQVAQRSPFDSTTAIEQFGVHARAWGANGVLVTTDTIEIPANDLQLGPDGYPVRFAVEADLAGSREQVEAAITDAREHANRAANGGA
ncbi:hypothetical protein GTW29_26105 [Streptomyces sp. SID7834]|nr:hypothetical protein [Streptomyces sp. SID7834]MYT60143.1 hypothetical protein [Streptomyces sp. SID7834]